MTAASEDQLRWDRRYADHSGHRAPAVPTAFADVEDLFPVSGQALEVACGAGGAAVWLAGRGMTVHAFDVSPVAIGQARELAANAGLEANVNFTAASVEDGLASLDPDASFHLVLCHLFRSPEHYPEFMDLVAPGGVLAVAVLSEVGAEPGRFRAPAGELTTAFGSLTVTMHSEQDGVSRWIGRRNR